MAQYIDIEQAAKMSGLRVVLPPGIPGPWAEAIKGILYVKKIPFIRVRHDRSDYAQLIRWTAQSSSPVMIYNDERPRSIWSDQLFLAERLQAEPALVPSSMEDRALLFGLSNEICGETGFGWSRRLMLIQAAVADPNATEESRKGMLAFGSRYGYSPAAAAAAPAKAAEIVSAIAEHLESQRSRGSHFLIGDKLSALDIYWAVFAALIEPLPDSLCPMPPEIRSRYLCEDPIVRAATTSQLLAHRDFIYHEYLELPVDL
jgi:hypothetical protein